MSRLFRLRIIAIIASVLCVSFLVTKTEASPVATTETSETMTTEELPTTTTALICPIRKPCGWAIYQGSKKKINYFLKNNCKCAPELACMLDDEDLSLEAFIYRCKERSTQKNA